MGMGLENSRVLLTGASGGLGSAMARELHRRGAHVIVSARRADALESLCNELGERSEPLSADLADRAGVEALPGRAGRVDVLIANAALPASGPLLGFDPEAIDRALDVNLRAPAQLARALAPAMVERRRGHLVFVSSLAGKAANPGSALYSATKFGVRGLALGLAEDLVGTGVGVSTVFPGFIRGAGMFHESGARLPRGVGTRTPEDVATATADAIEKGRLEVDVAPLALRAGAKLAGAAPGLAAAVQRRMGSAEVAEQLAAGQSGRS